MRDIKFRGKSKVTGEWVYGYYYEWHSKLTDNLESYIHEINHNSKGLKINDRQVELIPKSVGQYTGLKDKYKNKEVYAKDIVKIHSIGKIGTVEYSPYFCCYEIHATNGTRYALEEAADVEVLGNEFEDSELLEKK